VVVIWSGSEGGGCVEISGAGDGLLNTVGPVASRYEISCRCTVAKAG
jgi:hypothetical protein